MSENRTPSRRDFLKGTTAAAGLALAGGLSLGRTAHAAGSDELKVALIGCGSRGRGAAENCLEACDSIKMIAVADAFAGPAKRCVAGLKKKYASKVDLPDERIFVGLDAYKEAIAAGPDIVLLCSPPGFHPAQYAAAIQAGQHVFMEKPCCVDAPGFRSVMETNKLADEKGLKVAVGLQRRHSDEFLGKIKAIHDGSLGDLILLRAYWNSGGIWFHDRKPGESEMEYQVRNWYHFVWLSGDNICEQHVHNLDVCNWAKNAHPVSANGMGSCLQRYLGRDPRTGMGQIFDNHFVEFTYPDGSKLYSQSRQMPNTWCAITQFVHGTKGCVELPGNGGDGYAREQGNLVNAIRKNEKLNDGWHGATSSFTAVLGRMATYSGQTVNWDEAAAKGPDEMAKRLSFDANPPVMPDKDGNYPIPMPGMYRAY